MLETLLDKLATYKEKTEAIKKKIKKALFYPAAVLVVAFVVTVILHDLRDPGSSRRCSRASAPTCPRSRCIVIDMSKFVQSTGWLLLILVVRRHHRVFLQAKKRTAGVQHFIDRAMLQDPDHRHDPEQVVDRALGAHAVDDVRGRRAARRGARFGRRARPATSSTRRPSARMRDEVATGQRLQRAMENTDLFPNMVMQMIAIGEESGSLDAMLGKVADFYEEEVDDAVDSCRACSSR